MQLSDRKNPRLKDFDYSSKRAYFITFCTLNKKPLLIDNNLNHQIIKCLIAEKKRTSFLVYVYCLMPDHFHLLICPSDNKLSVSGFIGGLKSKITKIAWDHGLEGKLWQSRFHDHIVRKKEDLAQIGEYILNNPVRKQMVDKWQDYEYCGIIDSWV